MSEQKRKLTAVSYFHYFRLFYRAALFILLVVNYIKYRLNLGDGIVDWINSKPLILTIAFFVYIVEMIMRFFPSKLESPGCQKQFKQNYIKNGKTEIKIADNNSVMLIGLMWLVLNASIGILHMFGIIDDGIMVLLCSAFSVCDIICILFFCPFQSWFMKNKCCSVCRIYNWDYAMMFTPLYFIKNPYFLILIALSVALLFRWEITFYLHPERFSENTNDFLKCSNCTEKLCTHKKQLKKLWKDIDAYKKNKMKELSDNEN